MERLAGNVGYLDFGYFADPSEAGETAIAALNFLANCEAIIIDLRRNGGGRAGDDSTHQHLLFRRADASQRPLHPKRPTLRRITGRCPMSQAANPAEADLYILTSARSFSGAEEFTYNMKNLKRATVIGETTGGGAHPTRGHDRRFRVFILRVPFARAVNPITKTNWEGTGVAPDISVPAAEAFDRAYVLALETLAAKTAEPERKAEYARILSGIKNR